MRSAARKQDWNVCCTFNSFLLIEPNSISFSEIENFTLDTISTCVFGFDTDIHKSDDKTFLDMCKEAFKIFNSAPWIYKIIFLMTGEETNIFI